VTASFRVWDPDNCTEWGGSDVESDTVRSAAESYVESRSDYLVDNCDEVNVLVRTSAGKLYAVCVEIEREVTYRAGHAHLHEPDPPPLLTSILPVRAPTEPTRHELHTRTHEDDR
jgi:hypothetical protein